MLRHPIKYHIYAKGRPSSSPKLVLFPASNQPMANVKCLAVNQPENLVVDVVRARARGYQLKEFRELQGVLLAVELLKCVNGWDVRVLSRAVLCLYDLYVEAQKRPGSNRLSDCGLH